MARYAWREFMDAHINWYRARYKPRHDYKELWKYHAKADFNKLTSAQKDAYHEARNGIHMLTTFPPPHENGHVLPFPDAVLAAPLPPQPPVAPQLPVLPQASVALQPPGAALPPTQRPLPDEYAPAIHDAPMWEEVPYKMTKQFSLEDMPEDLDEEHGHWKPVRMIGQGGEGNSWLWMRYNNKNVAVDRMVVKDIHMARDKWHRNTAWEDGKIGGTPMEVALHRHACGPPASDFIVRYRGFRVRKDLRVYRIATRYAALNTMGHLVHTFNPHDDEGEEGENEIFRQFGETGITYDSESYERMPLRFALELFRALIRACKHMVKRNIVHRDLKPDNVLFGVVENECGLKPLICDFGCALPIESEFFHNPDDFDPGLTEAFSAPEQETEVYPRLHDRPMNEKTTVFQLGATMFHLIQGGQYLNRRTRNKELIALWDSPPESRRVEDARLEKIFAIPALKQHFLPLVDPVKQCMRFDQNDRPSLNQLLEDIDWHLLNLEDAEDPVRDGERWFAHLRR